ncbi:MAG: response regulator [Syntrophorhabdales bacterium]|jgi:PAS domain S-box-containing protein
MDDSNRTRTELINELMRARETIARMEHEVDRQRRLGEELKESEGRFRNLVEQSLVGAYLIQDGLFMYVNREFAGIFGYTVGEIERLKRPADLVFPDDLPSIEEEIAKRMAGEAGRSQYEFRGRKRDGEIVYVQACGTRTMEHGRPALVGTLIDRSDQKNLESQLLRDETIKAIGNLAGGIAHDFNNLLMAIQGHTSLLLHRLTPEDVAYTKLKGIEELVESGSDLTRKLLGFASGAKYEIQPSDLNGIIRKTANMFGRTTKEITMKSAYDKDLCVVDADGGQIEQMLLNLYMNAWQAMPQGGTLSVSTENVTLDERFVRPYALKAGRYALIVVADTGEGMDEKTKEHIFEPFFTTRRAQKGTGLGLASVYNVVKGHGGIITVQSETGRGTTFNIYLPASTRACEAAWPPAPAQSPSPVQEGAETILLVDDEEAVIAVSKDMLEVLGYSVLIAKSGREAIELFEKHHAAVDLVILDVVMPDMGGEETLARLRGIKPSVAVTLSSGYNLEGQVTRIMEQGCKSFIQKPFTINVLSQKLREALAP